MKKVGKGKLGIGHTNKYENQVTCKKQEWRGGGGGEILNSDVLGSTRSDVMKLKLLKATGLLNSMQLSL